MDAVDDDVVGEDDAGQVIEAIHLREEVLELVRKGELDRNTIEAGEVMGVGGE